jgi:hypothetical protein
VIAGVFDDLAVRPIAGAAPRRDVFALLPPGRLHPLVAPALAALEATAQADSIRGAGGTVGSSR